MSTMEMLGILDNVFLGVGVLVFLYLAFSK